MRDTTSSSSTTNHLSTSRISMLRTIVSLAVALFSASVLASDDNSLRHEFVEAMREVEEQQQRHHDENGDRRDLRQLHKRLLEKATFVGGEDNRELYYRNSNNYYNNNANNNNNNQYKQNQQMQYYFNLDFDWDLSSLAFKYIGCQNIQTWSDNMLGKQDNDNQQPPLTMDKFVMFRLCPKSSCSNFNRFGCSSNYGEYMVAMEDYLLLMSQYHFSQYDRYCGVCAACLSEGTTYDANDDGDDNYYAAQQSDDDGLAAYQEGAGEYIDGQYAANSNYVNGGYRQRRKTYGGYYYQNNNYGNSWYLDQYGQCSYQTVCKNYANACKNYNKDASYYEDFFTCSAFQIGNNVRYLGPHCRNDGVTIGIGIFEDQYCNNYVGDTVNIEEFTGKSFNDESLSKYYDRSCVSCLAKESYSLVTDSDYDTAESYTYPICNILYDVGGKCNRYFSDPPYMSSNEEATEETVCNLVASLVENNYDERGQVVIQKEFNFTQWAHASEYAKVVTQASRGQRISLTIFVSSAVFLFAYAAYLHDRLRKRSAHFLAPFDSRYSTGKDLQSKFSGIRATRTTSSGITSFRQSSEAVHNGTFV